MTSERPNADGAIARAGDPPGDELPTTQSSDRPSAFVPRTIGRYHIRRVIASGGMGTVFEAVQEQPRRAVALKLMKHGIASRSAMRRFEYESQILARLRHPGIAQVYEAGQHDDGAGAVPYFAMEYIPNAKSITEYANDRKLGTRERLELFAKVCEAVHHGHQKGIIHRDLKPANVLVDSHGQPKIIDFGVARATDSDMSVTTLQTDVGQLIGTLQYMSPEQCDADPHDLDTRSDVYALGVVLYELLCGRLPYDVTKVAIHEAARVIREESPPKPSTINRTLRGDVETITLKAMEKDRERRYRSAAEFAEDLQKYLHGEPITARPQSIAYQFRVFVRRNRAAALCTVIVFVAAPLIAGATTYGMLQARKAHRQAEVARRAEIELRNLAEGALLSARRQEAMARLAVIETNLTLALVYAQMRFAQEQIDAALQALVVLRSLGESDAQTNDYLSRAELLLLDGYVTRSASLPEAREWFETEEARSIVRRLSESECDVLYTLLPVAHTDKSTIELPSVNLRSAIILSDVLSSAHRLMSESE